MPYQESERLLEQYYETVDVDRKRALLHELGRYSVSLYQSKIDTINRSGALIFHDGIFTLTRTFYDETSGTGPVRGHELLFARDQLWKRNSIQFKVYGKYALFSDPLTRPGGEKFSYQTPTYQALKGIVESVYWKPTLIWYIDEARVMRRIQTESKGIRPIRMNGGNDLAYYTYLRDVEYQVSAHFEWNEHRPDLEHDRDENKHHNIALRSVKQGGRRDIFLGTRECQAYVEPCVFGEGAGFYDKYGKTDFGIMFHGFDYPDETGKNELGVRLWRQSMTDGVIAFDAPSRVELRRTVREYGKDYTFKPFTEGVNFRIELVQ